MKQVTFFVASFERKSVCFFRMYDELVVIKNSLDDFNHTQTPLFRLFFSIHIIPNSNEGEVWFSHISTPRPQIEAFQSYIDKK